MKNCILGVLLVLFIYSCSEALVFEESIEVYGHAYGSPKSKIKGMYGPLKTHIQIIEKKKELVFNGDFIRANDSSEISNLLDDIYPYKNQATFIRANHEFTYDNDSLNDLILNKKSHFIFGLASIYLWESYENQWNLTDEQIGILRKDQSELIIIISPEVFWWELIEEEKNAGKIDLGVYSRQYNSDANRSVFPNFVRDVLPVLKNKKSVILIAGDAGALTYVSPYYVLEKENITAVNSGMALGKEDNYVEINKLKAGGVKVYLRSLLTKEIIEELN